MTRFKMTLRTFFILSICLWSVGCQQMANPQFSRRTSSQSQVSQPKSQPTSYGDLFSSSTAKTTPSTPSNPPSTPVVEASSCARYTSPSQQVISACKDVLAANQDDLYDVAPTCFDTFNGITPNAACSTLVPQLENMLRACGVVLTTYRSYLGASCDAALQALFKA